MVVGMGEANLGISQEDTVAVTPAEVTTETPGSDTNSATANEAPSGDQPISETEAPAPAPQDDETAALSETTSDTGAAAETTTPRNPDVVLNDLKEQLAVTTPNPEVINQIVAEFLQSHPEGYGEALATLESQYKDNTMVQEAIKLKQEADLAPVAELSQVLEDVEQDAAVIEQVTQFPKEPDSDSVLTAKVKDKDGKTKTITIKQFALVGALFLADLTLFGGRYSASLVSSIANEFVREKSQAFLKKMGFNIETFTRGKLGDKLVDSLPTNNLVRMIEELDTASLEDLLKGTSETSLRDMLDGKPYGKYKKQLEPDQIAKIKKILVEKVGANLVNYKLEDLLQTTTTTAAPATSLAA